MRCGCGNVGGDTIRLVDFGRSVRSGVTGTGRAPLSPGVVIGNGNDGCTGAATRCGAGNAVHCLFAFTLGSG